MVITEYRALRNQFKSKSPPNRTPIKLVSCGYHHEVPRAGALTSDVRCPPFWQPGVCGRGVGRAPPGREGLPATVAGAPGVTLGRPGGGRSALCLPARGCLPTAQVCACVQTPCAHQSCWVPSPLDSGANSS